MDSFWKILEDFTPERLTEELNHANSLRYGKSAVWNLGVLNTQVVRITYRDLVNINMLQAGGYRIYGTLYNGYSLQPAFQIACQHRKALRTPRTVH